MKKALFTILLACVLGLNIYTLAKVTTFTQKEQEKQEFVQNYTLKDKQILDAYIENGDHKLVIWSEAKKEQVSCYSSRKCLEVIYNWEGISWKDLTGFY